MKRISKEGFMLSFKWLSLMQGKSNLKFFIIYTLICTFVLWLYGLYYHYLLVRGDKDVASYFIFFYLQIVNFTFGIIIPYLAASSFIPATNRNSSSFVQAMPATESEKWWGNVAYAVLRCLVLGLGSLFLGDTLAHAFLELQGKNDIGLLLSMLSSESFSYSFFLQVYNDTTLSSSATTIFVLDIIFYSLFIMACCLWGKLYFKRHGLLFGFLFGIFVGGAFNFFFMKISGSMGVDRYILSWFFYIIAAAAVFVMSRREFTKFNYTIV
ncbi:MAG: hypothetical protein ACOYJG_06350 [Prevotella sp.]|jgi:hypothetical protein